MRTTNVAEKPWRTFQIPGSLPPVSLKRLSSHTDGSFTVFVRFPPGWSRPGPGHYDAAEEVLFLEGQFGMSNHDHGIQSYGWFPEYFTRAGSSSSGALALAWFSSANDWTDIVHPEADVAERGLFTCNWPQVEPTDGPVDGLKGRMMIEGPRHTTWMVDHIEAAARTSFELELFDLDCRRWVELEAGEELPVMPGPAQIRVINPEPDYEYRHPKDLRRYPMGTGPCTRKRTRRSVSGAIPRITLVIEGL